MVQFLSPYGTLPGRKLRKNLFSTFPIFSLCLSQLSFQWLFSVFFINSALPPNNGLFVFLATASMSGLLNLLVNAPVSYALGKMDSLKQTLCTANISSVTLSTAVSKSKAAFTAIAIVGLIFLLAGTAVFAAVTYSKTVTSTGSVTAIGNIADSQTQMTLKEAGATRKKQPEHS